MDALSGGAVPDDVITSVLETRGGDRGHVAQELARQAGPFREALKRVAIATKLGRKIDKDRDSEAGGDDLTDEDIVQRLREMGPCPMGFAWHREGSGWRCGGGSHFVRSRARFDFLAPVPDSISALPCQIRFPRRCTTTTPCSRRSWSVLPLSPVCNLLIKPRRVWGSCAAPRQKKPCQCNSKVTRDVDFADGVDGVTPK